LIGSLWFAVARIKKKKFAIVLMLSSIRYVALYDMYISDVSCLCCLFANRQTVLFCYYVDLVSEKIKAITFN